MVATLVQASQAVAQFIRRFGLRTLNGVASKGVRLGNWLSLKQAQALLNAPDITTTKGLRDRAIIAVLLGCGLRRSEVARLRPSTYWSLRHQDSNVTGQAASEPGTQSKTAGDLQWVKS